MTHFIKSAAIGLLMLGACAHAPPIVSDPGTQIAATEAIFGAAVAGELVYLNLPHPDVAVVTQLEKYRKAADKAIRPFAMGAMPTTEGALAAQIAVQALTSYMDASGISYTKVTS